MRIRFLFALIIFSGCLSSRHYSTDESAAYVPSRPSCAVTTFDTKWIDATRSREVPVLFRIPQCDGAHPLIIFSHGIANSRNGYAYLGDALARAGYVVAHVQHHGSDDELLKTKGALALYRSSKNHQHWIDRANDIRFVLDQLSIPRNVPAMQGTLDLQHIGVAGHSYGAFTALTIGGFLIDDGHGGSRSFYDERVQALVALSTPKLVGPDVDRAYAAVRLPVLHMTGTRDRSLIFRTSTADRLVPFQSISAAPQLLVVLNDAGHSSFSNDERRTSVNRDLHVRAINLFVTAFFDEQLRHDVKAAEWLRVNAKRWLDGAGRIESKDAVTTPTR